MKSTAVLMILAATLGAGCAGARSTGKLTAAEASAVTDDVTRFVAAVAARVTQEGPGAWSSLLASTPDFFMVVDGRMQFEDAAAAAAAVENLKTAIDHIELRWGDPVRVEPLTTTTAIVAAPYYETRIEAGGNRVEEDGYFTGLAELGSAGWRLRNAHWSTVSVTGSARLSPSVPGRTRTR